MADQAARSRCIEEPRDTAAAHEAFQRVTALCAACHNQYRDVPLGEKNAR
jgi:cytochrome c556